MGKEHGNFAEGQDMAEGEQATHEGDFAEGQKER